MGEKKRGLAPDSRGEMKKNGAVNVICMQDACVLKNARNVEGEKSRKLIKHLTLRRLPLCKLEVCEGAVAVSGLWGAAVLSLSITTSTLITEWV